MKYLSVCSGIEAATLAWGPLGWQAAAYAEIDRFASAVLAHHYPETPNLGDFTRIKGDEFGTVDLLPDGERDWMMTVAFWPSNLSSLLAASAPPGWYGRTSPASCRLTKDGRLEPFSGRWATSGMGSHTEFLTLNTLEFPSGGVASSLSDILETGDLPRRFYLSGTACRGILRRAEARGRKLPEHLKAALEAGAGAKM